MSVTTSPPAPPKKRGLGCLGCGCLILALLAFLVLALVAAVGYIGYAQMSALTSSVPLAVPSFDGGDEMYNSAVQKVTAFDHDLHDHQAAMLQLSGDEINTLIARDPYFTKNKVLLYVTLADNDVSVKTSIPTSLILYGILPGRYLNGTTSFGLNFDSTGRNLNLDLQSLQIGEKEMPQNALPTIQTEINPALNQLLQRDPDLKLLLEEAKSIEIQGNELVIETE
jgi:hypothetical protein